MTTAFAPIISPPVFPMRTPFSATEPLRPNLARSNPHERSRTEKMKSRIKLLLVDDHPVVRRGIGSCLAREEHLTIVGDAANGIEAMRKARELLPDIILMDIDMPQMNRFAGTEALRKESPQIKVLIHSIHSK